MDITLPGPEWTAQPILCFFPLWNDIYGLRMAQPTRHPEWSAAEWSAALELATRHLVGVKGRTLLIRVEEQTHSLLTALPGAGFKMKTVRDEFKTPVADLPTETGTPFQWSSLQPLGPWNEDQVAQLMSEAASGDPDFDPEDDPLTLLRGYLTDPALSHGPDCVQVGMIDKEPAAIVIAQVNPETGWSRITYMGLIPRHRGKGLGTWVQRHGFEMIRSQHGVDYHGGTLANNIPMLRLFQENGCKKFRRLQEWTFER